jgi:hypothetical protein
MSTSPITKQYTHGGVSHVFAFREDGWFNMTKAAKAFHKDVKDFYANKSTREYISALESLVGET